EGTNEHFLLYTTSASIERYKTSLMTKRSTQTYDINYQKTFSPVTKLNIVQVLLSMTMNIPRGHNTSSKVEIVYKLRKITYLIIYVEDMFITRYEMEEISRL
ncbi:hypothetical protein CR513_06506, partial [Mucuna pruriens]